MELAYLTLLSLVPLLAVCFVILKAFGVHDQLQPLLVEMLLPLGNQGQEVAQNILDFVGSIKIGVLGATGVLFLFYTIIALVRRVENSFNGIWHISGSRSLARTFSDYLSVILIGPVLLFIALGLKATLLSNTAVQTVLAIEPFGTLLFFTGKVLPYLLVCGMFAFLYGFIPNTRVHISAAVVGGGVAGLLWYVSGWLFTAFVVSSSNYSAVYSSVAGIVLFIVWVNLAWLITLLGALVSYCWQHPPLFILRQRRSVALDQPRADSLALCIMTLVGVAHCSRGTPWTRSGLCAHLHLSPKAINSIVNRLLKAGLIAETRTTPCALLPLHALDSLSLQEVVDAVQSEFKLDGELSGLVSVATQIEAAVTAVLQDKTVADLVVSSRDVTFQSDSKSSRVT